MPARTKKQLNPVLKLALEMGPLLLFFFANARPALFIPLVGPLLPEAVSGEKAGIFVATAVFMVAILLSLDRKSTRLNSSHTVISYAVFCLKKKNTSTKNARRRSTRRRPSCGRRPQPPRRGRV